MTADSRSSTYPLEALHQREGWRLEMLQSELAAASRRLLESREHCDRLRDQHRAVAADASPRRTDVIDPDLSARRLLFLRDLQQRAVAAGRDVLALETARDRLHAASLEQRTRYESIEQHRQGHFRDEALRTERQRSAEADREWLARSNWRRGLDRRGTVDPGPVARQVGSA